MTKDSKVRLVVGLAVAAAVVGFIAVGASYAQQPPPPPHRGMWMGHGPMMGGPFAQIRRGLRQLGLSDQQKSQIQTIFQGHKTDLQGFAARMQPARKALNDAITSGANEATIGRPRVEWRQSKRTWPSSAPRSAPRCSPS